MNFLRRHQDVLVTACVGWVLSTLWVLGLTHLSIPSRVPQNAVMTLLISLCFLPVTILLVWLYDRYVLVRLGKTTILWRMTIIPIIALLMTGVVLITVVRGGNAPVGPFFAMEEPRAQLQVSTYSSNGSSLPAVNDANGPLLVDFYRSRGAKYLVQSPSRGTEVSFEAGVLLGTGPYRNLDLSAYESLALKLDVTTDSDAELPLLGVTIKDAFGYEIKCTLLEPFIELEGSRFRVVLPLKLFSGLSLECIDIIGLFVRDLKPGQRAHLELSELRCE